MAANNNVVVFVIFELEPDLCRPLFQSNDQTFIPSWTGVLFDGDGDDGGDDHLPLVSLGFGINPQVSWDMVAMVVKGEEDQTIEEGLDLW